MAKRRARSRRRAGSKRTRRTSLKKIELRPIRRRVEQTIRKLRRVEQTAKVRKALKGMKRCLGEIRMICGPSMMIPIP